MSLLIIAFLPLAGCIIYIVYSMRSTAKARQNHQRELEKIRLSEENTKPFSRYCRLWHKLSPTEQKELILLVDQFLETFPLYPAGKSTEAIPEDLRYGIAVNACLLILGEGQKLFPDLRCIFVLREDEYDLNDPLIYQGKETLIDDDKHAMTLNEAIYGGNLILTVQQITDCGKNGKEAPSNAVLMAFADNLNSECIDNITSTFSLITFADMGKKIRLSDILKDEWNELCTQLPADLPEYAVDNEETFFREVTNAYFENSRSLAQNHPGLYLKMAETYGVLEYQKRQ